MRSCLFVSASVKPKTYLDLTNKTTILWASHVRVTAVTAEMFTYCLRFIFCFNYFFSKNNRDFSRDNKTKLFKAPFYGALFCLANNKTDETLAVTKEEER